MDILIISSIYPEPTQYGIKNDTKAVHYFAKEWVNMGNNVVVLHQYLNPVSNIKRRLHYPLRDIKHYELDGVQVVFGEIQLLTPHAYVAQKKRQLKLAKRMQKYIQNVFPDFRKDCVVVHFPMTCKSFASYFIKNVNSICTMHGVDLRMLEALSPKKKLLYISEFAMDYESVFFRSSRLKQRAEAIGFDTCGSEIIYSGISPHLFGCKSEIEKKKKISFVDNDVVTISYVGNLNKQKNIITVIKALALIEFESILYIVGDGPELEYLNEQCRLLGIQKRVVFTGKLSREEVAKVLKNTDIFVMVSQNETFGLVYLEAMAQCCITIGSSGEGIDGVISDGVNGFLVESSDYKELANLLTRIFKMSSEEKQKIKQEGYNTAKKMTDYKMAEAYLTSIVRKDSSND